MAARLRLVGAGGGVAQPHQPLLRDRGDEGTVAREDQTPRKTAGSREIGAVLGVEQPIVSPERTVEPQRMIQARAHKIRLKQRAAVRHQGGIEQRHVGRIGEHALVDCRIIRQGAGGPDPDMESAIVELLAQIARDFHRTQIGLSRS